MFLGILYLESTNSKYFHIAVIILVIIGFYFLCFYGEETCVKYSGGKVPQKHYIEKQYFLGLLMWKEERFIPGGVLDPDHTSAIGLYYKKWRGFGFVWFSKTLFG